MFDTHALARATAHRPWPLQDAPWVMSQSWRTQLFAHWPVQPQVVRALVPAELDVDVFHGNAWLGVTPFRLAELRVGPLPQLPIASDFPELNVRTYVTHRGKPGVYFFSLDAASHLAVLGARFTFGLPYYHARMILEIGQDGWARFESHRLENPPADFIVRYQARGAPFNAIPGSFAYFVAERYALYTVPKEGRVMRGDIHHLPWRLQEAVCEIARNTMPHISELPGLPPPAMHYSTRQDALIWAPILAEDVTESSMIGTPSTIRKARRPLSPLRQPG
jgi:uncharacterized protein YqjF (DUF2071 family)